jgi:hypothetical protein
MGNELATNMFGCGSQQRWVLGCQFRFKIP